MLHKLKSSRNSSPSPKLSDGSPRGAVSNQHVFMKKHLTSRR